MNTDKDHTGKGLIGSKRLSKDYTGKDLIFSKRLSKDHTTGNGGQISSSSSTLSTLRPYPVGSKPLSEDLVSRIKDLYDDVYGVHIHELLTPIDCIDPDDPVSVKDYTENPGRKLKQHYLFPNEIPHVSGEKIFGEPVFELYYIKIKKLDPLRNFNFSSIFMLGSNTDYDPFIIYNRPEDDEEITLNQHLPLKNIFRLPSALYPVSIALSNPSVCGWRFWIRPTFPDVEYEMCEEDVKDQLTDSVASISYELIQSAAVAELHFAFLDGEEGNRPIKILDGSIFVTTNGKSCTERLVRQFSQSMLHSKEPVPLNRSVFGFPIGSNLHLEINLNFIDEPVKSSRSSIHESLTFSVPKETRVDERCIDITRSSNGCKYISKLMVKVFWWDCMV